MIWNMIFIIRYMMWYMTYEIRDMIYLTAVGLTPGGSSTVLIYTQTIHRTTQRTQKNRKNADRAPSLRGITWQMLQVYPSFILLRLFSFVQSVSNLQNWQTSVTLFRWIKYKFQLQYFPLPSTYSSQLYMKHSAIFIVFLYVIFLMCNLLYLCNFFSCEFDLYEKYEIHNFIFSLEYTTTFIWYFFNTASVLWNKNKLCCTR